MQSNQVMVVVGGGDAAGKKCITQIEATRVVVGTVGTAMDSGETRAKGKMSGWHMMQGDWAAEDATGEGAEDLRQPAAEDATRGGGRWCKAIKWWMTREERGDSEDPTQRRTT